MRLRATKKKDRIRRRHLKQYFRKETIDQTCNVYDAEQYGCAVSIAKLKNRQEVLAFIAQIKKSKYWRKHNPCHKVHRVKFTGRGARWASAGRRRMELPDNPWARNVHVIVHEMAHGCHPNSEMHGKKYIHSLLILTREFEGTVFARTLKERFYQTGALKRPRRRKKGQTG